MEINGTIIADLVIDQFSNIENWFLVAICGLNEKIIFYSENLIKYSILTSNKNGLNIGEILFDKVSFYSQNHLEISRFTLFNSFIDFYDINQKNIFIQDYFNLKKCDPECIKCDNYTGVCLECTSGNIPLNNSCPMMKTQIILNNYYGENDISFVRNYTLKDYLRNNLTEFNSFNYTISFNFAPIIRTDKNLLNQMMLFSLENTKKPSNYYTYQLFISNNFLYLRYFSIKRNLINYLELISIDSSWTNIFMSHSVNENILTIFILNECRKIQASFIVDNIIILSLDLFTFFKIGGYSDNSRYVGYIYDFSIYTNKLFNAKTIQISQGKILIIQDLYLNNSCEIDQCSSPLICFFCAKQQFSINNSPLNYCISN